MVQRDIQINAPIETLYKVIRDFSSYPDFVPAVVYADEDSSGEELQVQFTLDLIKKIKYTLRFNCQEPLKVAWTLVKGDFMKVNTGSWTLEKISDNQTKATYSIEVGFGWMVPKTVADQLSTVQLPQTLEAFKQRAEKIVRGQKRANA